MKLGKKCTNHSLIQKNTSEDITKTMVLISKENSKALENIKKKLLEIMDATGVFASYLLSAYSKITNPENTSQIKSVEDQNSNRVNDLLIHVCSWNICII